MRGGCWSAGTAGWTIINSELTYLTYLIYTPTLTCQSNIKSQSISATPNSLPSVFSATVLLRAGCDASVFIAECTQASTPKHSPRCQRSVCKPTARGLHCTQYGEHTLMSPLWLIRVFFRPLLPASPASFYCYFPGQHPAVFFRRPWQTAAKRRPASWPVRLPTRCIFSRRRTTYPPRALQPRAQQHDR